MAPRSTKLLAGSVIAVVAFVATVWHRDSSSIASARMPGRDSLEPPPGVASTVPTRLMIANVDFHTGNGVVLRIRRLTGEMRSLKNGIVDFDDIASYAIEVSSAEVGMTGPDLTNLMNNHVFAYRGSPLSHLRVEIGNNALRQTGTLHKGVDIPFDMTANVALTTDGRIMLHATRVHILGVNGLSLMKALGLSLEKMMDLSQAHGVTVKGNDLILDAIALLPPPSVRGRLTAVRVDGDQLVQTIGTLADSLAPRQSIDPGAANFMLYRGGTLHFGKLFMTNAEMLVVDADQHNPFDFDNPRYQRQLVAGRSKTLPDLGLEVWMPDAASLGRVSDSVKAGSRTR
jgi:Domain of unknown function (DUF811).